MNTADLVGPLATTRTLLLRASTGVVEDVRVKLASRERSAEIASADFQMIGRT
jgi:hypothetical protein